VGASRPDLAPTIGPARQTEDRRRHLEFIEVRATADVAGADLAAVDATATGMAATGVAATGVAATEVALASDGANAVPPSLPPREQGWSLWGDLDR
jgi:hypothetical protein